MNRLKRNKIKYVKPEDVYEKALALKERIEIYNSIHSFYKDRLNVNDGVIDTILMTLEDWLYAECVCVYESYKADRQIPDRKPPYTSVSDL